MRTVTSATSSSPSYFSKSETLSRYCIIGGWNKRQSPDSLRNGCCRDPRENPRENPRKNPTENPSFPTPWSGEILTRISPQHPVKESWRFFSGFFQVFTFFSPILQDSLGFSNQFSGFLRILEDFLTFSNNFKDSCGFLSIQKNYYVIFYR